MPRAQAIVCRHDRILLVKHRFGSTEYWCLPGGGIHANESPADAALRELEEECGVRGRVVRATSVWMETSDDNRTFTFLIDIGTQQPQLGLDPELRATNQVLADMRWLSL